MLQALGSGLIKERMCHSPSRVCCFGSVLVKSGSFNAALKMNGKMKDLVNKRERKLQ